MTQRIYYAEPFVLWSCWHPRARCNIALLVLSTCLVRDFVLVNKMVQNKPLCFLSSGKISSFFRRIIIRLH